MGSTRESREARELEGNHSWFRVRPVFEAASQISEWGTLNVEQCRGPLHVFGLECGSGETRLLVVRNVDLASVAGRGTKDRMGGSWVWTWECATTVRGVVVETLNKQVNRGSWANTQQHEKTVFLEARAVETLNRGGSSRWKDGRTERESK